MPSTEYHNMYRDKASKLQESHLEKDKPEITSKNPSNVIERPH